VQFLGSTLTILALVNAGMGLALVPRGARVVRFENILFRPITLATGIHSELHLVWRDDNDNPAFLLMLDAIRQSVANLPA
jgi:DNA-binding transcriptional LysR family regulator